MAMKVMAPELHRQGATSSAAACYPGDLDKCPVPSCLNVLLYKIGHHNSDSFCGRKCHMGRRLQRT